LALDRMSAARAAAKAGGTRGRPQPAGWRGEGARPSLVGESGAGWGLDGRA